MSVLTRFEKLKGIPTAASQLVGKAVAEGANELVSILSEKMDDATVERLVRKRPWEGKEDFVLLSELEATAYLVSVGCRPLPEAKKITEILRTMDHALSEEGPTGLRPFHFLSRGGATAHEHILKMGPCRGFEHLSHSCRDVTEPGLFSWFPVPLRYLEVPADFNRLMRELDRLRSELGLPDDYRFSVGSLPEVAGLALSFYKKFRFDPFRGMRVFTTGSFVNGHHHQNIRYALHWFKPEGTAVVSEGGCLTAFPVQMNLMKNRECRFFLIGKERPRDLGSY